MKGRTGWGARAVIERKRAASRCVHGASCLGVRGVRGRAPPRHLSSHSSSPSRPSFLFCFSFVSHPHHAPRSTNVGSPSRAPRMLPGQQQHLPPNKGLFSSAYSSHPRTPKPSYSYVCPARREARPAHLNESSTRPGTYARRRATTHLRTAFAPFPCTRRSPPPTPPPRSFCLLNHTPPRNTQHTPQHPRTGIAGLRPGSAADTPHSSRRATTGNARPHTTTRCWAHPGGGAGMMNPTPLRLPRRPRRRLRDRATPSSAPSATADPAAQAGAGTHAPPPASTASRGGRRRRPAAQQHTAGEVEQPRAAVVRRGGAATGLAAALGGGEAHLAAHGGG